MCLSLFICALFLAIGVAALPPSLIQLVHRAIEDWLSEFGIDNVVLFAQPHAEIISSLRSSSFVQLEHVGIGGNEVS